MTDKTKEIRTYSTTLDVETRESDSAPILKGHAAVFDSLSLPLGGFREKIARGAFDSVLGDDTRALFNHDPNMVLGRSKSGTLRLSVDSTGLSYEIELPDTQVARDLKVSVGRGDITQSSFAFRIDEDKWEEDEEGRVVRTILSFKELLDVSPVTYPAYVQTDATVRSFDKYKQEQVPEVKKIPLSILKARLDLEEKI